MNQIISTLNQLVSILEKGITINVKVEGLSGAATMESTQQQVIGNLIKEALEASSQQTSLTSSPSETQKDETVLVTESSSLPVEEVVAEPQECPAVPEDGPTVTTQPIADVEAKKDEPKARKAPKKVVDVESELSRKIASINMRKGTMKASGIEIPDELNVVPQNLDEANKILAGLAQLSMKALAS